MVNFFCTAVTLYTCSYTYCTGRRPELPAERKVIMIPAHRSAPLRSPSATGGGGGGEASGAGLPKYRIAKTTAATEVRLAATSEKPTRARCHRQRRRRWLRCRRWRCRRPRELLLDDSGSMPRRL